MVDTATASFHFQAEAAASTHPAICMKPLLLGFTSKQRRPEELRTVSVGMGPAAARPAETMRSRRAARRGAGMLPAGLCALLGLCLAIASSAAAARGPSGICY